MKITEPIVNRVEHYSLEFTVTLTLSWKIYFMYLRGIRIIKGGRLEQKMKHKTTVN